MHYFRDENNRTQATELQTTGVQAQIPYNIRDNDRFLIPTATAACRPRTGFVDEDEKLTIQLLIDLIDSLSPVGIFIFII